MHYMTIISEDVYMMSLLLSLVNHEYIIKKLEGHSLERIPPSKIKKKIITLFLENLK